MKKIILIYIFGVSLVGCSILESTTDEEIVNHPYLSGLSLAPLCQNNLIVSKEIIGKTLDAHYGLIKIEGFLDKNSLVGRHGFNIGGGDNPPETIIETIKLSECTIKSINNNTIYEMYMPQLLTKYYSFRSITYNERPFMYFEYIAAQDKLIPLVGNQRLGGLYNPDHENFINTLHPANPTEYVDIFVNHFETIISAPVYLPKPGWVCGDFSLAEVNSFIPTNELVAKFLLDLKKTGITNICYKGTADPSSGKVFVYDIMFDNKF